MRDNIKKIRRALKQRILFAKRQVVKPSFPENSDGKVLVHIGCGKIKSPEFINVDAQPFPHVHIVTSDISSMPEFEDSTVDMVYMCHILEHLKTPEIKKVLPELKRILKKGGVLRISVPDFDKLIEVYNAADKNIDFICRQLMGGQDNQYNIHYSVFNYKHLSEILSEGGFSEIRSWDPENCQYHNFKDRASRMLEINGKEILISLNLEAVK